MKLENKPISPNPQAGNVKLGKGNEGLTLLEHYAGNAPEMPNWFHGEKEDIPPSPNVNDYPEKGRNEIRSWLSDGTWDLSEDCGDFQKDFNEWRHKRDEILRKNKESCYFQWRIYYAKALIAELEKQQ
jgi:hypothetical protein